MRKALFLIISVLTLISCHRDYSVKDGKLTVVCENAVVRLQAVSPGIIRVSAVPDGSFTDRKSLSVVPQPRFRDFKVIREGEDVCLLTSGLKAVVSRDGSVSFFGPDGNSLAEGGTFGFDPIEVEGKKAWSVRTRFGSEPDESFYGLGQQQAGEFDHKGRSEELYQYNTKVSVPFIVSTKGYGLLFDAYSLSRWGKSESVPSVGRTVQAL